MSAQVLWFVALTMPEKVFSLSLNLILCLVESTRALAGLLVSQGIKWYCLPIVMPCSTIMIVGFKSGETKRIFDGFTSRSYPSDIQKIALRKLLLLDAALSINDLRVPPGNRLEKLMGARKGQRSIRINSQWRICFIWTDENNADQVEIVDYH